MDVNFFKKKFYGQTNSALLSLSDESWNSCIKKLYKSEVLRSGRTFVHEDYVDANIRLLADWIESDYISCIMTGGVGIGKTVFMKSLMRLFDSMRDSITIPPLKYRHVLYFDAADLCIKYVASEDVRCEVVNCKVLFIDDLGCEAATYSYFGNVMKPIHDILMSRYAARLPTVIATNLSLEEFAVRYGDRVADRVNELYDTIEFPEHDSFRRMPLNVVEGNESK